MPYGVTMNGSLMTALKILSLTLVLFVCFAAGAAIAGLPRDPAQTDPGAAAGMLLVVCFIETVPLSYLILRSRWAGWRLIGAVFVVYFGVTTFMSQIETAVFLTHLPPGVLPRLFLMGAVIAAPFSVAAVAILGKWRAASAEAEPPRRQAMPPGEWAWKLAVIAVVYVILYFTFGYLIAWRSPAVREYYGGIDEGAFFAQMRAVARDTPWLIPFQVLRGVLWALIAVPVMRLIKGPWQEAALILGVLFGIVMTAPLLLPNPYMPDAVRMAHLVETGTSNFLFGVLIGWLARDRPRLHPGVVGLGS